MKSVFWIAKREIGSFFYSPIFYVVTTVFLVLYSFLFFAILSDFSQSSMERRLKPRPFRKQVTRSMPMNWSSYLRLET